MNNGVPTALDVADLEVVAEELKAYIDRRLDEEQPAALLADLEVFAEEVRAHVDQRVGEGLPAILEAKLDALIEATVAMTKAFAAPKKLVLDDLGRPIGVQVMRSGAE